MRRVQALFAGREVPAGGGEWPKPDYTLAWPAGVDERDPDIGRADLPVNLPTILRDLDTMRGASEQSGAELVLASFFWLVKDGMMLDPVRHRAILEYINRVTRRSATATSSAWPPSRTACSPSMRAPTSSTSSTWRA